MSSGSRDGWPAPYWGDGFPCRSWWRSPGSRDNTASAEPPEANEAAATGEDDPEVPEGSASDLAYQPSDHWSWSRYHQRQDSWSSSGWDWGTSAQWSWHDRNWARAYEPQKRYPELVPEFAQAWLLLTDAGLESSERNLILTAIQGDLTLSRVAQELRNHFPEGEIKKKELSRRQQGFFGELEADEKESEAEAEDPEEGFHAEDELTEEGCALWSAASYEGQQAMAALQTARRTLKGARERQKMVKLSRQYYKVQTSGTKATDTRRDERITCLRCGRDIEQPTVRRHSHRRAPNRPRWLLLCATLMAWEKEWLCKWIPSLLRHLLRRMPWRKARQSWIVERQSRWAPCTLLSSDAAQNGISQVDTNNRPVFGFGNSSEDKCVSTCI